MKSNQEMSILDRVLPDKLIKIIHDLLIEVQPKHIDEVGFYDIKGKLLIVIFPAIKAYMSYSDFETDKKWLRKSDIMVKRQFKLSEICKVRVYSEEVKLEKKLEVIEND